MPERFRTFKIEGWEGGYTAYGIHDTLSDRYMWTSQAERDEAFRYLQILKRGGDEIWSTRAESLGWARREELPAGFVYDSIEAEHKSGPGKHSLWVD